jgi:hypothetical protein
MPTSALTKFHPFLEAAFEKKHNLGSDSLVVWLSNTAPAQANAVLTDITQVSYTNMSSRAVTITSSSQTAGTYSLVLADLTLTMTGGASPTFRYVGVYNDTSTNDDLVAGYLDYGAGGVTLADGESLVIDFNASGLFTAV